MSKFGNYIKYIASGVVGGLGFYGGMIFADHLNNENTNSDYLKPKNASVVSSKAPTIKNLETNLILDLNDGVVDTIPLTSENAKKIINTMK